MPPLGDLPTLEDLEPVDGRRVLVRADLNVPLRPTANGFEVADDFRIRSSLPTLEWLVGKGAEVTVCSHLGRPKGNPDPRYSMKPVRRTLESMLPGLSMLENLRFDPGEESNDPDFVKRLVNGFDCYVNDAFGSCHRAHASIVGPPEFLPSAAGRLLFQEVAAISRVIDTPRRPLCALIGGAKVADKIGILRPLADRANSLLLGGAMCFTFLASVGRGVGASPVETGYLDDASNLLRAHRGVDVPSDLVALSPDGRLGLGEPPAGDVETFSGAIPEAWTGCDIGPDTARRYAKVIAEAGTILWNGPMGVFEDQRFGAGTASVARAVAHSDAYSVVGGGETVAAVRALHLEGAMDHVSSGGGATLELIEKGDLPGLVALRQSRTVRPIRASRPSGSISHQGP
jgi:phosphoglycerate kinase